MAVFVAKIANLIGWGEVATRRGDGWTRNKFKLKLDGMRSRLCSVRACSR